MEQLSFAEGRLKGRQEYFGAIDEGFVGLKFRDVRGVERLRARSGSLKGACEAICSQSYGRNGV
jgi:hypothetical protein